MTAPTITSYDHFLHDLKSRIRAAGTQAALSINRELILLYWQIGRDILERQEREGWGTKVIDLLATDLRIEFPNMKGFSRTNLMHMRSFAEAWDSEEIVQRLVGQPFPFWEQLPMTAKATNAIFFRSGLEQISMCKKCTLQIFTGFMRHEYDHY